MTSEHAWELLDRGGLTETGSLVATLKQQRLAESQVSKYNGLVDPAGAEELGRALAEKVRSLNPTVILLWEDPEDIVLGHIIGRELGVPVVRSYDADGLVEHIGDLLPSSRVLLLADAFRDLGPIHAMQTLIERQGGIVVGIAVLVEIELGAMAADGATVVTSLVRVPTQARMEVNNDIRSQQDS